MVLPFATGCMDSLKFWDKKKEVELVNKKLPPFEVLFNRTVVFYNNKQYKEAINSFLFLRENYPGNTVYQSRITLYLADSHYKLKEYPAALVSYRDFIKFYPRNPDIPYAWFQIGMSNYKQRRTYDRDASFIREAMAAFKKVLQVASPGVLTNESIRMIAYCQRDLTLHEMFIADFYYRTHHYESAILRYNSILTTYKNIKVADRAHLGIAKSYLKLKEKDKALPHLGFVARYYPLTAWGKTAWKILGSTYHITSRSQLPDTSMFTEQPGKKSPSKKLV
jgi:outer membrane protein assembly factor BamD